MIYIRYACDIKTCNIIYNKQPIESDKGLVYSDSTSNGLSITETCFYGNSANTVISSTSGKISLTGCSIDFSPQSSIEVINPPKEQYMHTISHFEYGDCVASYDYLPSIEPQRTKNLDAIYDQRYFLKRFLNI